jgi:hypothetical protein
VKTLERILFCVKVRGVVGGFILTHYTAAAFGGEIIFLSPVRYEFPNVFLAAAVTPGGIYKINPGIEHRIQNGFGLPVAHIAAIPDP